ncbi:MAG TPA: hypothetical protein VE650_18940 [Acetobacteraceae bacterium]|nr:hypothetical protein [Acetobacteraceae bacterium]
MMISFETIGAAQLLAVEGQQQMARELARAVGRVLVRMLDRIGRHLPQGNMAPW